MARSPTKIAVALNGFKPAIQKIMSAQNLATASVKPKPGNSNIKRSRQEEEKTKIKAHSSVPSKFLLNTFKIRIEG